MRKGEHRPSKPFRMALGWKWLAEFLDGRRIGRIAIDTHRNKSTVRKYMKEAAEALLGEAQAQIMTELVPLAKEVMAATLRRELADIKAGAEPKTHLADRILKGMGVIDQIQPEHDGQSGEPDTLVAVLAHRTKKQLKKTTKSIVAHDARDSKDVVEGETIDANQDNPTDKTEG